MNGADMKYREKILLPAGWLTAVLICAPCLTAVAADQEEGTATEHQLQPIVVEGKSITPQREELNIDSTSNPYRVEASAQFGTEVFTAEDIKNLHPQDLNDLIDKAAGINLTYQGRKSPFFIEDRGDGNFTYIIDGAVLPPSANRILYKIPLAAIEELQIVRGSTSLTLGPSIPIGASNSGSGLNTGYIIIRTKQPQKTEGVVTASVDKAVGGQPMESKESLYVGTPLGGGDSPLSPIKGYIAGVAQNADKPSLNTWFDGTKSTGGMGMAGFSLGILTVNGMAYKDIGTFQMQRGLTTAGTLDTSKWYYDPLETNIYSTDMRLQWTPNQTTLLNIFQVYYDQTEIDDSFASNASKTTYYNEATKGVGLRHNARFGDTLIQIGGQISDSTGFGPDLNNPYNKFDTTVSGWSASVEQKLFKGRLVLDGGYREDVKHIGDSSTSVIKNVANNDVDCAPAKIYAFGSRLKLTDTYILSGRYYHGDEGTIGSFDMQSQTGVLHPEKQERIEVGLEANYVTWFNPSLTWFNIDIDNEKTATNTTYALDGNTYYYYTEANTKRDGLELALKGTVLKNTTYKASWTHLFKDESTSNGVTTDALGVTEPANLYSLMLTHRWNAYRANFSVKRVDGWMATSSAMGYAVTEGLGDYTLVDANIQRDFQVTEGTVLTVTLFGINLGDQHYSTRYVTGYYEDRGRTIGLELSYAF